MAVAAKVSWNPLRCSGAGLEPNLLLMAKLIALCLLATNHVRLLPDPFLPFVPFLDRIPGVLFQRTLQVVFLGSAVALLFNRRVRISCLVLGLTMILAVLSSKAYYGNNKLFCGSMLLLAGLGAGWAVRCQLAIVYFGAGLNKLLDADWRSGQFFEHWAAHRLKQPLYLALGSRMPPLVLGKILGWTTIGTELGLSGGFVVRRLWGAAVWGNILFQSAMLLFTGDTFTMFFYAMTAASLAFVEWPGQATVIYDGDCGFCNQTKQWWERWDLDRVLEWTPLQSGAGARYGIAESELQRRLYLVTGGRICAGFAAFKKMALYNPITYFVMAGLLLAPFRRWSAAVLLLFFSPLFAPVGEAAYNLVARNRGRLGGESRCQPSRS